MWHAVVAFLAEAVVDLALVRRADRAVSWWLIAGAIALIAALAFATR